MTRSATATFAINKYVCHVRVCVALPTTCRSAFSALFVAAVIVDDAQHNECSQAEQCTFLFVIHLSATPILAARARCMFIISYNYDARIAVH